jgi:hypothetical protein
MKIMNKIILGIVSILLTVLFVFGISMIPMEIVFIAGMFIFITGVSAVVYLILYYVTMDWWEK